MGDNYEAAAVRHYADAKLLKEAGRKDGAGHLVGFAAECAIKFRIQTLQPNATSPQLHLPDLLAAARKKLAARGQMSRCIRSLRMITSEHGM